MNMPISEKQCPLCGGKEVRPLIYGDLDLIDARHRALVVCGEVVCGGDAVMVDSAGRAADMACLSCRTHWGSTWVSHE